MKELSVLLAVNYCKQTLCYMQMVSTKYGPASVTGL